MKTPVADTALEDIVSAIVPAFAPARILLFGSRARGEQHDDSDYDIMVLFDDESPRAEAEIHGLVSRASRPVDVIATTVDRFERRRTDVGTLEFVVAREGQILYERQSSPPPRVVRERPAIPESFGEWVERAESDYLMMNRGVGDARTADATAFHAHQCVEKYLKANLVLRGVAPPRTHVLAKLLELSVASIRADARTSDACALLDRLWPLSRYPKERRPTTEEVAAAVEAATLVRAALTLS
ncbi:MAG TPA: HEPN domain-containing protein [Gemmatimonadaceae bacterium]|nr:HEPN domain-containing protein [Gemmatimonadaceae bacterium]